METKESLDCIAYKLSLDIVETTSDATGYPRNLEYAILVDDNLTWNEIEDIANENDLEIISLHKRDGWQLWAREGLVSSLYDGHDNPEFNCDTNFFESNNADDFWQNDVKYVLEEALLSRNREEFMELANHYNEIAQEIESLTDDEFIAYSCWGYDKYPKHSTSLHGDTHHYNIALIRYE